MLFDITLKVTPELYQEALTNPDRNIGHMGTHFDVMNKEFPLAFTRLQGRVFDVSGIRGRDITSEDVDLSLLAPGMFVAFHTGWLAENSYGTKEYFAGHPQLAVELIDQLLTKGVSIIGIDGGGVRRGKEHTPMDQHCADHDCFIIENMCGLDAVLAHGGSFVAHTYPLHFEGWTGLPCRVVAEVDE